MSAAQERDKAAPAQEGLIEFASFPPQALDAYIATNELAPTYPPPASGVSGPTTSSNSNPNSNSHTQSNSRSKSSKSNTDDGTAAGAGGGSSSNMDSKGVPTHFFDHEAANSYLGAVADRHFFAQPAPKEGEVVVGFLYRCRTKDSCLRIAQP